MEFGKSLVAHETPIPGLSVFELTVNGDNRGWFKENWQRSKMVALGLPDFRPVQNNISFNDKRGTTRGFHAEPWDKFVSVATGRIFGAWVDLRQGPTYGQLFTIEVDPSRAVFVPRGVANAYQTLDDGTAYSYLVNAHWSSDARYTFLNLADETVDVRWPIPLADAELSSKDRTHPRLPDVEPVAAPRILVTGANGQLGKALRRRFGHRPEFEFVDRSVFDIGRDEIIGARNWSEYSAIINAAAYTAVDQAETSEGRVAAWETNVIGVARLADIAHQYGLTLVHISSDYVFDGEAQEPYPEDARVSPLGVYGQTKAAGDAVVGMVPRHYILRTSWVVGEGSNFVRTMKQLAERGIAPRVVGDQWGRLSFTADIAAAVEHLLSRRPECGTYNVSSSGPPRSWAQVARNVFDLLGHDPGRVQEVTTLEYFANAATSAPRPRWSVLDLRKIQATGFVTADSDERLAQYLRGEI